MDKLSYNLPSSWPMIPLGALCEVGAGIGAPQGDEFFAGGAYPFVRMQDVGRSQTPYLTTTADRLNDFALEKFNLKLWPAGSLLIPKSGASVALNKRALLREPSYVVSHLAVLVPGTLVDSEFLFYLMCTLDMMRLALDPAYPSLRTSDLARLRIPLPPLSEQRRIVEILQEAEEIRRLRAEAEVKASELLPSLFSKHFFSDLKRNCKPLHTLADVVSGVALGRKTKGMCTDVPYMRVANVQAGYVDLTEIKSTPATDDEIAQFALRRGDVLMTEGGDFDKLGRGCLWDGQVDPCIHQNHVFRVRPLEGKLNSQFFAHYLQSEKAKYYFLRCAKKTTNLASINLTQLKALPVPDISIEDQERFEQQVEVAGDCSSVEGTRCFKALSRSLSAHAFSGQLTADWREAQADTLAREARERDAALKQAGAVIAAVSPTTVSAEPEPESAPCIERLLADLGREQLAVWRGIVDWDKALARETKQENGRLRYFTAESISKALKGALRRNPQAIEGHLAVLAARGLVIPVSREEQTEDSGQYVFGNAYRLVSEASAKREENDGEQSAVGRARSRELERLAAQLEKERTL